MRLRSARTKTSVNGAGARWRVHGRIMLGPCSNRPPLQMTLQLFSADFSKILDYYFAWQAQYLVRLGGHNDLFNMWTGSVMWVSFRGRPNVWWSWIVSHVAPHIVNDVSCVTTINDERQFSCQAQYLVTLEDDFSCCAQCKWRFICNEGQFWSSTE